MLCSGSQVSRGRERRAARWHQVSGFDEQDHLLLAAKTDDGEEIEPAVIPHHFILHIKIQLAPQGALSLNIAVSISSLSFTVPPNEEREKPRSPPCPGLPFLKPGKAVQRIVQRSLCTPAVLPFVFENSNKRSGLGRSQVRQRSEAGLFTSAV